MIENNQQKPTGLSKGDFAYGDKRGLAGVSGLSSCITNHDVLAQSRKGRKEKHNLFVRAKGRSHLQAIYNPFNSILDKIDVKINKLAELHFR
jgi:hypothetical protein